MRYYFYCPNCRQEEEVKSLPHGTMANTRGGYGGAIYHYECPKCNNLDAGYMRLDMGRMAELADSDQKTYFRSIIALYQGIRGIKD